MSVRSSLAKLTKAIVRSKTDVSITNDIAMVIKYRQQQDEDYKAKRNEKIQDGFHLSGAITKPQDDKTYCSRQLEIQRRFHDQLKPWRPPTQLQRTFDHGHSLHRMLQTYLRDIALASDRQAGLYGKWLCRRCNKHFLAFAPTKCHSCDADIFSIKYREYPLLNKEFQTTTTADGLYWVNMKDGWHEYLIEAKSIKQRQMFYGDIGFDDLMEPLPKHVGQAQGYAALRKLELDKGPKHKLPKGFTEWPKFMGIIYLYYGKDSDDIKEYHQPLRRSYWRLISDRIKTIQENENDGTFSPRISICTDIKTATKETRCPVVDKCFELKNKKVKV